MRHVASKISWLGLVQVMALPLAGASMILGASGCIVGNDSGPPVLAVDLFWDENPKADRFSEGTCQSAGVTSMDWTLTNSATKKTVIASTSGGVDCQDGFNFEKLGAGDYTLTVTGYDAKDKPLWTSTCTNLTLDRFDANYACDVDQ